MEKLLAEGSPYDRVLVWAALFVGRLHSFNKAIEEFAGDSHLAAQLVYIHCASLLKVRLPACRSRGLASLPDLYNIPARRREFVRPHKCIWLFYRCSADIGSFLN
jgi:hypothetical protein